MLWSRMLQLQIHQHSAVSKITAEFANTDGQSIDAKLDAILNALVQNAATSSSPNPAGAIAAQFDNTKAGQNVDAKLDAILNALVQNAGESTTTDPATTISGQFANNDGQSIDAKLDAILNALVQNAATNSNPEGQITAQFDNTKAGQALDSKMDAVLNALVMNAGTQDNPTMSITQVFDNTATKTVQTVMANADLALNSLVSESLLHVIYIEFSY